VVGSVLPQSLRLVLLFLTSRLRAAQACLGAVIIVAAIGLIEPDAWRSLAQAGRSQVVIAAVTTAGVVLFRVLEASSSPSCSRIVDVVMRSSKPHDAVLGYVPRLDRWADVSLHPEAA